VFDLTNATTLYQKEREESRDIDRDR
jgi:hypothetical protein